MDIREIVYSAKTKKTEIKKRRLTNEEIDERDKAQQQAEDERLMLEYLAEKEKEKQKAYEEWRNKKGK